ncbi:MAG: insulinase family protein [Chloroflexi bacterium]|nr:insulinase family protein [Chloroflexota bacterium]
MPTTKTKSRTTRARRSKPAPQPAIDYKSLPGPDDITRRVLPNGIVVLVRENHTSPSVVIDGAVKAGALLVPRDKAGLANFTAGALMRGTENRAFGEIYEAIESVGASLSIHGGNHGTGFGGKSLAEDLGLLLELLADALRRPTFPAEHVEKLRGEILTGLNIRAHDTGSMASLTFAELTYPDHPYAVSTSGYIETVSALKRDDLVAFHRKHFGPRGMLIIIVGAFKTEEAIALVEKYFGDWQNPDQPDLPDAPAAPGPASIVEKRVTIPGKTQSDLILGVPGPRRADPDFLDARLGNGVLGVFGMMGRIGDAVREKGGMAYYAFSSVDGGHGPGPWRVVAGVNPKNVERAVELIRKEIRRFVTQKITPAELADNQSQLIGRLPLQLETNEGVAGMIASLEEFNLGLDYLRRYPGLIRAITRESVLAAARKYLDPDKFTLAIAGPE